MKLFFWRIRTDQLNNLNMNMECTSNDIQDGSFVLYLDNA